MPEFIIAQVLGFIGICLNLSSLQFNKHFQILTMRTLGTLFFVAQYVLLKAYVGVAMDAVGIIRNIVFTVLVAKNKNTKPAIWIFSFLVLLSGIITVLISWDETVLHLSKTWSIDTNFAIIFAISLSLLSICAKLISTISFGIDNPHVIRIMNIPAASGWLLYNLINLSLTGIINEAFSIGSSIVGEIRFKKTKE